MSEETSKLRLQVDDSGAVKGAKNTTKALKTTAKQGDKTSKSMKGLSGTLGNVGKAFGALGVGFGAMKIVSGVKGIIDAGDELQKMSVRLGTTTEDLSRLEYASELSGSSIAEVETSVRYLNRTIDESSRGIGRAVNAFDALGVSGEELSKMSMGEQMEVLADAFGSLDGITQQTAVAMDLFGRSGTAMLNIFSGGSDGLKEMTDEADRLGITLSQADADAMADFNDSLTEMKGQVLATARQFTSSMMPALQNFTDATMTASGETDTFAQVLGRAFGGILQTGTAIGSTLGEMGAYYGTLISGNKEGARAIRESSDAVEQWSMVGKVFAGTTDELEKSNKTTKSSADQWRKVREELEKVADERQKVADIERKADDEAQRRLGYVNSQIDAYESLLYTLDPVAGYYHDMEATLKTLTFAVEEYGVAQADADALMNEWMLRNNHRLLESNDAMNTATKGMTDRQKILVGSTIETGNELASELTGMFVSGKAEWQDFAVFAIEQIGAIITELVLLKFAQQAVGMATSGAGSSDVTPIDPITSVGASMAGGGASAVANGALGSLGSVGTMSPMSGGVANTTTVVIQGDATPRTVALLRAESNNISKKVRGEIMADIQNGGSMARAVGQRR